MFIPTQIKAGNLARAALATADRSVKVSVLVQDSALGPLGDSLKAGNPASVLSVTLPTVMVHLVE